MNFEKMKILVIDDNELIRLTTRNSIKRLGCSVIEAENGTVGVALYEKERPDLVIADILMPEKEGLETIADIRALNPAAKIIAISGGGSMHNISFLQLAENVGANRTMTKPLKPDDLVSEIKNLLSG